MAREQAAEASRINFLHSSEGARAAEQAAGRVFAQVEAIASQIGAVFNREGSHYVQLFKEGFTVTVSWHCPFANTTEGATLNLVEWEGRPDIGQFRFHSPNRRELRARQMICDADSQRTVYWRSLHADEASLPDSGVADHCGHLLLSLVRAKARRR